jgi:hypothetical protein
MREVEDSFSYKCKLITSLTLKALLEKERLRL